MSSVDNRIVNMQFNNKDFIAGAAESSQALDGLESTISNMGGSGSLQEMGSSIDQVSTRFSALQIAGVAALATIASKATSAAISLGQDLLGSVTSLLGASGFSRAIDLQQARFQFRGLGLDVKEVMQNATDAVDGTAFALNEAAGVASQFAGGGVKAGQDMETALRGVAGVAAQTGRSYKEIGEIFAGVAATGKLSSMDLFQFQTRNLDVTGALADELGKTQDQIRAMVSAGQIDFKTFSIAMDNAFGKNAAKANRTFTGALANMKTAITRIGADFFSVLLKPAGDVFNALQVMFHDLQGKLEPVVGGFSKFAEGLSATIVKFIQVIKVSKLIKPIMEGIGNIFAPLAAIFKAVGEAWATVFPEHQSKGVATLYKSAKVFEFLTRPLQWLAEQIPKITPLFVALFEAFRVGWAAVSGLWQALSGLKDQLSGVGSSIIDGILGGLDSGELEAKIVEIANNIVDWIKGALGIASPAAELVPVGTAIVQGIAEGITNALSFIIDAMGQILSAIFSGMGDLFSGMDALDWTAFFNSILAGGLLIGLISLVKTIKGVVGTIQQIAGTFTAPFQLLTQSLQVMQNQVRAQIILNIAIAIGVMTLSIIALSLLDPKKAAIGLGILASELALMVGTMAALGKINPAGIIASSTAILVISSALVVMAAAIAILGNLGLATLAKGLGAMAIGLGIMVVALHGMVGLGPGLPAAAAGIFIMASAMVVMSAAIAALGNMDMGTLAKGLGAMAIGLAIFTAALYVLGDVGPLVAAASVGIFIVASAMVVMAGAIAILGTMDMGTLAKGIGAMAVGLILFVASLTFLTALGPGVVAAAGSILIMSVAMLVMSKALGAIGGMSLGDIAKALGTIAIALVILLAAAAGAEAVAPGLIVLGVSVALLGAGVALLGLGLLAGATAFAIFAAVGTGAIAVVIAGISAFMALLPVFAVQLATAVVVFIETIAAAAPKLRESFGKILTSVYGTIRDSIPEFKKTAIVLLDAFFDVIIKSAPKFGKALMELIKTGLKVLEDAVPRYVNTGVDIVIAIIKGLTQRLPEMMRAGTDLIIAYIQGIGDNTIRLARAAADVIIEFIHALADTIDEKGEDLRTAGLDLAHAIINGLTGGLLDYGIQKVQEAITELLSHIPGWAQKMLGIASPSKVSIYWGEMIVAGLVKGISDNIKYAVGATIALANAVISAGDKVVAKAQKQATKRQIAADKAAARAQITNQQAKEAEKLARQSPKNKALQKAAKDARNLADKQTKAAEDAQKRADAAAQHVSNVQAFRDADKQGKADILTTRAKQLSDRATKMLAKANAEALAAKKLHGKERDQMMKQAKADAAAAKKLADKSKASQKRADDYYAQTVRDRIKAIKETQKAEDKARKRQHEFDKATDAGKAEILQRRAEAARERADKAQKQSDALIKQAKKLAKTDAVKAQRLLDQAERLAQRAKDAADQAKQDRADAKQYAEQAATPDPVDTTTTSGNSFILSLSAMEDAASSIDRYTKSLQQAEEAASAATPVYQFVQNNNSPESLTDTEIYRQTKNLLSTAEIKMVAPS